MTALRTAATALLGWSMLSTPAFAQETIDIGTIRNDDITVVQRLLYPKAGRAEIGLHVGVMPFDAYILTPNASLSYAQHLTEQFAFSFIGGAGYGFKTDTYRQLESPTIGVAPDAYSYLGSALAGLEWAPIYAKLNFGGARITHFDVYGALRGGASLERRGHRPQRVLGGAYRVARHRGSVVPRQGRRAQDRAA